MIRCLPPLVATLALLAGCNLAPAYRPPATVPVPASFKEAPGWAAAMPADAAVRGEWWSLFADPVLDALERKVVITNQNVALYRATYQAARALVIVQRSALFPTVTASGSADRSGAFAGTTSTVTSRGATTGGVTTSGVTSTAGSPSSYALSIGASWEPDLWGRVGNGVRQARAGAEASAGDLANATLSAQGELATDYVALRGIDAQIVLLDRTIVDYRHALRVVTNQYGFGTVAHSDVYQAQASLQNAIATREDLDRQRALDEHAIAVLAGENPSTFSIAAVAWKPTVPAVPAVVPATLLQRRPDIAAAERRVAAANANIGIQRAAYFPQIGLAAGASTAGSRIGQLFSAATSLWSLGLSAATTLLDFGARHGQVLQARAQFDEAAATYRQTVLTAFQQVEDELAATRVLERETRSRAAASDAATRAQASAENQYAAGTIDYTQVIVIQMTALTAQQTRIEALTDQQTAAIALIQAIGGDWAPVPVPVAPPESKRGES